MANNTSKIWVKIVGVIEVVKCGFKFLLEILMVGCRTSKQVPMGLAGASAECGALSCWQLSDTVFILCSGKWIVPKFHVEELGVESVGLGIMVE